MRRNSLSLLMAAITLTAIPRPLHALTISLATPTNATGITTGGGGSGDRAGTSGVGILGPGSVSALDFIGSSVTGTVRYTSNVAADRGVSFSGSTAFAQANTDYNFNFNVDAPAPYIYEIVIATSISGSQTSVDDSGIGASGSGLTRISDVTGQLNGNGISSLGLDLDNSNTGATSSQSQRVISQSNSYTVTGLSGLSSNNLRFTWTSRAESPQNVAGGDENAVRLGANGPLGGASADDYPGPFSRNQSLDGHFVNVTARITGINASVTPALSVLDGIIDLQLDESLVLDASATTVFNDTITNYTFNVAGTLFNNGTNPLLTLTEAQLRSIPGLIAAGINTPFTPPIGPFPVSVAVTTGFGLPSTPATGSFIVVPEVQSVLLVGLGMASVGVVRRRRKIVG